MNWKRVLPLLLLLYLFFLVVKSPASRVIAALDVAPQDLALERIEGTLFSGHADHAIVQAFPLGRLRWRLEPSALLLGCLQYRLDIDGSALQDGQGRFGRCLGSRIYLKDASARLDARELGAFASNGLLVLGGEAQINISALEKRSETYTEADGSAAWRGAVIEGREPVRLGTVTVSLEQAEGNLTARLSNQEGDIVLTGTMTLEPGGRYQMQARLAERNGVRSPAWLGTLASRQQDGRYLFRHAGKL